jgi:hypothetical protein
MNLSKQESFTIDSWYEKLEEYTFKSVELNLTFKEAKKLLKNHQTYVSSQYKDIGNLKELENLEVKINNVLKTFSDGAFIKLNTRSPKDVPHFEIESLKFQSK